MRMMNRYNNDLKKKKKPCDFDVVYEWNKVLSENCNSDLCNCVVTKFIYFN